MIAAVLGQILELTEAENWEQTTGISVADTIAAWETVWDEFHLQPECAEENGGAGDYTLQDEYTLESDTTTFSIDDLDLLDGKDLLVECLVAQAATTQRQLIARVNNLTSTIYYYQTSLFGTSTSYSRDNNGTAWNLREQTHSYEATLNKFAYTRIHIPRWKDTGRYPQLFADGQGEGHSMIGKLSLLTQTDVDSLQFYQSAGDMRAGSMFWVYTRG